MKEVNDRLPQPQHLAELRAGFTVWIKATWSVLSPSVHWNQHSLCPHSSTEMISKTCNAEVPLGTGGTQGPQRLFTCSDEILSYAAFVIQVPRSHPSPGFWNGSGFAALRLTQNATSSFPWQGSQQQAVSQPSSPSAPTPSCSHGSTSSDLIALEWDLNLHGEPAPEQSNPAALWVTSLECLCLWGLTLLWLWALPSPFPHPCCCWGWPGSPDPQLCFPSGGPKCFQLLQLSVECCSLAVLKLLEVLHSLHVPLK